MTPPAISCAWATIKPANETPGTTIKNSARATTRVAASLGRTRSDNQSCTGAKTAYSTGMPMSPVAYGVSEMTSPRPSSKVTSAAR